MTRQPLFPVQLRAKLKVLAAVSSIALMVVAAGPAPHVFAKSYRHQLTVHTQTLVGAGNAAQPEDEPEEEAEDEAEAEAEEEAEDEAEAEAEGEAEDEAEQEAEREAENEAEQEAEGEAEEEAEDEAERQAEQEAEEEAENEAERQAEFEAEEEAEREAEDIAEREAEDDYEDEFEDDVEDDLDDEIEDDAEDDFEDDLEREEEDDLEGEAEEEVERQSEQESEDDAEDLNEDFDDDVDDEDFDEDEDIEEEGDGEEFDEEEEIDRDIEDLDGIERARRDVQEIERMDRIELMADRAFEEVFDEVGESYIQDEVLVLLDIEQELELEVERYIDEDRIRLDGLDMMLVRARIGEDYSLDDSVQSLGNLVTGGAVDVNHVFETEAVKQTSEESPMTPAAFGQLVGMEPDYSSGAAFIGLVDTRVETSHPAFTGRQIVIEDFARFTDKRPVDHGTAVASILVGDGDDGYRGLMPNARLYAASVFVEPSPGRQVATTESLILAIDWMVRNSVPIVNMSLSGPANELLEFAITRAASRGSHVVAAVGNAGPTPSRCILRHMKM